jgi:hypothetical protein
MNKPISFFERVKGFFTSCYEVQLIRTERTDSVLPSLMSLVHCKKDQKSQEFMQRTGVWIVGRFHSRRKAEKRAREEQRNNQNWAVKLHKIQGSMEIEVPLRELKV